MFDVYFLFFFFDWVSEKYVVCVFFFLNLLNLVSFYFHRCLDTRNVFVTRGQVLFSFFFSRSISMAL